MQPEADLAVNQRASPSPARVGAPLTYTVVVTNGGLDMATGVVLTDTLPASASLDGSAATQGGCAGAAPVTCSLGSLASGAALTVTVTVSLTAAGTLTNTVTASAAEFDPAPANNTASETTEVRPELDLYLPLVVRSP